MRPTIFPAQSETSKTAAMPGVFGIVLNHRNVENEKEKVQAFSEKIGVPIVGEVPRSDEIIHWEEQGKTVIEGDPTSDISKCFLDLAALLWKEEEYA